MLTFTRVTYRRRPDGFVYRVGYPSYHRGHTATTRRQLAAWNAANKAWHRMCANPSGVNVDAFHAYKLAERAWELLTNLSEGPDATAHLA